MALKANRVNIAPAKPRKLIVCTATPVVRVTVVVGIFFTYVIIMIYIVSLFELLCFPKTGAAENGDTLVYVEMSNLLLLSVSKILQNFTHYQPYNLCSGYY